MYIIKGETYHQPRPETGARGWCTGKTQRDGIGREEGGGIGMGTRVNPWLINVNVWQKTLKYCKVISLQLMKINEKTKQNQKKFLKNQKQTKTEYPLMTVTELEIKKY